MKVRAHSGFGLLAVMMLGFFTAPASADPLHWVMCKGGPDGVTFTDVFALEGGDRAAYAYNLTTTELQPLTDVRFSRMWVTWSGWPSSKYGMMLNRYSGELHASLVDPQDKSNFGFDMKCERTTAKPVSVATRKF